MSLTRPHADGTGQGWPARRAVLAAIVVIGFPWLFFETAGEHGLWGDLALTLLRLVMVTLVYGALLTPLRRTSWWRAPQLHGMVILAIATGAALAMVIDGFVLQLLGIYRDEPLRTWLAHAVKGNFDMVGVTPAFMLCSVALLEHGIVAARQARARALRAERMLARQREARLNLLRLQLHPHFLFNALNSVAALLATDRRRALDMMDRLQSLYSRSLRSLDRPLVPLREELDWCRQYLAVESVRFADRLRVALHVEPGAEAAFVPPLLLQPLVENAIRHGVGRERGRVVIEIKATLVGDDTLRLLVANSSSGTAPIRFGFGLRHSQRRLAETYGGSATLVVERRAGRVEARVEVPQSSLSGIAMPAA